MFFEFYLVYFLDYGEKMKRLNVVLLLLTLSVSQILFANETEVISEVAESVVEPVVETTKEGPVEAIQLAIVKLNQLTSMSVYSPQMMSFLVDTEIAPLFDFDYIADEVLLVIYRRLNEDETRFFSNKLKNNIITTLLTKLSQTRSTSFRFISARPIIGGNIIVKLKVNGYSRYGMYIDLVFHQSANQKWQIFDIVLNNDSLINYYQKMVSIKSRRYGVYGMLGRI